MKNKKTLSWIGTIFFTILGLIYIAPIIIVLLNSFKKKSSIWNRSSFRQRRISLVWTTIQLRWISMAC